MLDPIDRRILLASQDGLPLSVAPFAELARRLGLEEREVLARLRRLREQGVVRRIAAVPNHFRLGFVANAMTVWDVDDREVSRLGRLVGALPFVSHCYRRPRRPPDWPFNLFAMIHGKDRAETEARRAEIARLLGEACRGADVLYSLRILKKTGLRLRPAEPGAENAPCSA
ncbi:MAG: AsnC family transcriptional regulator [Geminicoccaceae bacterium]|nr:AsnC family transcriptional regulator [Geminicoccaceae bacterium]MCS7269123.1 AsnC family transcriptional regulator [Geminicoccaceae bacterium]MCX7630211.1 AsnC family transcriptional regulator [Geminicoccaceae bacterium]MDW8125507.1 AsnC family transcriptional regulator [Geminicoccaceae bacterium]MDW8341440.1 AsnC family transcriptional regulator [Geminicoccaceae bacterium]